MLTVALFGVVAAYVILAVLLLSLNISSLWRWWVKGTAIVLTTIMFVVSYVSISGMIGWPSTDKMPNRFSLLHTRIVEPNREVGTPGHIYLWLEEVDDKQLVISAPRAFEVPYEASLAEEVASAQDQLDGGEEVLGELDAERAEQGEQQGDTPTEGNNQEQTQQGNLNGQQQNNNNGATPLTPATPELSFSEMPAVALPEKTPEQ